MKFIKNIIDNWKYNHVSNVADRTFIAHRERNGVHEYAAAVQYKRLNGKIEYEIKELSIDNDDEWIVCCGGVFGWIDNEEFVKQAIDNYIDLNLERGKYARDKVSDVEYIKYP